MSSLDDYYAALERLKADKPVNVPRGTKITNDAVSLEAARGKGSIKKSRPMFAELIKAIAEAGEQQSVKAISDRDRLAKSKASNDRLRKELDAALARELSLLNEVFQLRKTLSKLTGANVLPLRK